MERGWRAFGKGSGSAEPPVSRLYRNNRNGSFADVTKVAGVGRHGWGQAVCVGDYDNDGFDDLFVDLLWPKPALAEQRQWNLQRRSRRRSGVAGTRTRWGSGAAFLDYDKDGRLDLIVANYIDLDLKTAPTPESGPCLYKGLMVACGPPGLDREQRTSSITTRGMASSAT
jgi:hypothetical protein